jgi:serine/threonine protein kinase
LNSGVLHRDISIGNILLTEKEDDGFLIDYDLAVELESNEPSGAPSKTGTKVFMAIGALNGEHHNFMHDLESFFWVLFWICIYWDGPNKRRQKGGEFDDWNVEPVEKLAKLKIGLVSEENSFTKDVDKSFSEYCRSLIPWVKELRRVTFPGGTRWLKENRTLYAQMKAVLEKAKNDPIVRGN